MPSETIESRRIPTKSQGGGAVSEQQEQLPCPRCDSINTKFCYYNNYNFSQPRHFCKTCRRYWTHGGTLRDIPVGGVSRKSSKRSRICSSSSSSAVSTTVGNKSFELQTTPVLFPPSSNAGKGNGLSLSGGFTSLLNHHTAAATVNTNGHGVFIGPESFGIGLGGSCFDDGRFGQGITVWPFLTGAEATPAPMSATWQFNGPESKVGFMPGEYLAS